MCRGDGQWAYKFVSLWKMTQNAPPAAAAARTHLLLPTSSAPPIRLQRIKQPSQSAQCAVGGTFGRKKGTCLHGPSLRQQDMPHSSRHKPGRTGPSTIMTGRRAGCTHGRQRPGRPCRQLPSGVLRPSLPRASLHAVGAEHRTRAHHLADGDDRGLGAHGGVRPARLQQRQAPRGRHPLRHARHHR